jgi:hypothetical protein
MALLDNIAPNVGMPGQPFRIDSAHSRAHWPQASCAVSILLHRDFPVARARDLLAGLLFACVPALAKRRLSSNSWEQ